MNLRLTLTAGVAVILASVSIYPLIETAAWFWAGVGAVIAVMIAGIITRLSTLRTAVGGSVLALIAVSPLLASPAWALKALGAIIVAVTAASRARLRVLQALACLIAYLAALLIYLNAVFAARLSAAGIVPTWASVSYLSSLVSQGMAERTSEPPVPSTQGVILLAAAGIGLMAMLTDLLAVRLRRPAVAGLPLLALYCVRITTSARQGGLGETAVFCLGMIGYLALLAADGRERLRIWGRLVTVWQDSADDQAEAPDTRALAASGRRIGLAAACIALAFPLLVPGISVHDLFRPQGTGTGQGSGTLIAPPNPLVQMKRQLLSSSPQNILTYHTTARDPREQYLQVFVLNYDPSSENWVLVLPQSSTQVGSGPLRPVPGVKAGTPETTPTTSITLSRGRVGYDSKLGVLPLPYAPATLGVQGSWQEDDTTLMVFSTAAQLSGLTYTVKSDEVVPDQRVEDLGQSYPPSIGASYLKFPAGPDGKLLLNLADRITKNAHTPYQKALALQNYFLTGAFTYNLSVNLPNGITGLMDFLFKTRNGYCQQFAFAMAALARLVHIPSRIAVGYTAGTPAGKGVWKVTSDDAHAWPELYFSGMGWIRFEPTPGGPGGQGTAYVPAYAQPSGPGVAPAPPAAVKGPGSKPRSEVNGNLAHIHHLGIAGAGGTTPQAKQRHSVAPWILLAALIAGAFALVTPLTARSLIRRHRLRTAGDAELAHAAWRELRDNLADYGLACRASESPRAVAGRVAATLRLDSPAREALGRIVGAEERACYAPAPIWSPSLRADTAEIRQALSREAGWATRWRARLLPPSMLAPVRPTLQHALDVFGWMDAAGLRLRSSEPRGGVVRGGVLRGGVLRGRVGQQQ
jgi:transglutaminase-like putative cysteine protease